MEKNNKFIPAKKEKESPEDLKKEAANPEALKKGYNEKNPAQPDGAFPPDSKNKSN